MTFISEHVIPGDHGRKFTTDAKNPNEIANIREALLQLDGVKDVQFYETQNPVTFVVHTDKVVSVEVIENCVKTLNLHAVPTGPFFPLA
ncbi:MAG TPA: heavy-metal-associated domain-containing protein [Aquaticitalea sp.]|nr:heavy-metal-associated domain-containing protein [Aquaticitalea sp.]HNU59254.1 heavy-metal-associated domain-containing protein [Aquaticitalea sp.]